ncbi:hypothetical protein FLONG3_7025 [Fusarium longipes]|uniref:Uncharacterized protein n=1 Tax=Fusarium longipes TaxID=694270 RepID=A0A395SH83_9HYPO|nr:hypothetical protein FLONG3_7025 [Fusarium longipes]
MAIPEVNDVLRFEVYRGEESDRTSVEVRWSQFTREQAATYYIVDARNTSKGGNADTILFIRKPMYTEESNYEYVGKIPGAVKEGDNWVVPISDRFQYGQQDANGEHRFLVLHGKVNKIFQVRGFFSINAAEWAQKLAKPVTREDFINQISSPGRKFGAQYLKNF